VFDSDPDSINTRRIVLVEETRRPGEKGIREFQSHNGSAVYENINYDVHDVKTTVYFYVFATHTSNPVK
jgi:hypothetical protein